MTGHEESDAKKSAGARTSNARVTCPTGDHGGFSASYMSPEHATKMKLPSPWEEPTVPSLLMPSSGPGCFYQHGPVRQTA